jgi:hypothetical protein
MQSPCFHPLHHSHATQLHPTAAPALSLQAGLTALEVSRQIAAARAAEAKADPPLFVDPYAPLLEGGALAESCGSRKAACDVISTQYIDESMMNAMAATNVSTINKGEDYRQVCSRRVQRSEEQEV